MKKHKKIDIARMSGTRGKLRDWRTDLPADLWNPIYDGTDKRLFDILYGELKSRLQRIQVYD